MGEPWEHEDGSTNVAGFLAAYAEDDNAFWRADSGHIMNVLDDALAAIAARDALLDQALELPNEHRESKPHGVWLDGVWGCGTSCEECQEPWPCPTELWRRAVTELRGGDQ